jgi:uncharacterized protein YneF (UPF0154 family)
MTKFILIILMVAVFFLVILFLLIIGLSIAVIIFSKDTQRQPPLIQKEL